MAEVITLGEPMVVLIPHETGTFSEVHTFSKGIAGAELNVAIGVKRLEHSVQYISRLGDDIYGDYIADRMKEEKLDTSALLRDEKHLTGAYFKTKVLKGDPSVHYLRKNSAASCMGREDIEKTEFSGGKILHLTGIAAAVSKACQDACQAAIEKARQEHMVITFDPNIRLNLWKSEEEMIQILNKLAIQCDVVMPGIKEGRLLTGKNTPEEITAFYLSKGVKKVLVKLGEKGAYFETLHGEKGYVDGYHVEEIVDTVGAGDAFAAGVLTAMLEELPIEESVKRGNAMGSIMITSIGDNDAMPTREVLEKFMKGEQA